jgi:mannose-1-phosphate guanylyltransferase
MAGGAGTRFWPASRRGRPKQLLRLAGDRSMIQATLDRIEGYVPQQHIIVLTNHALVAPMRQQLPGLPAKNVLGEPHKRDTAPCIGLAAALVLQKDPQGTMLVMPADHVIDTNQQFQSAVDYAVRLVDEQPGRIVTFGIRPTYAAETFGYVECGEPLEENTAEQAPSAYRVKMFREKPSAEIAQEYLAAGKFYWNSGIFVWKAETILQALQQYEPAMYEHLQTIAAAAGTDAFSVTLENEFAKIEGKSIDYAVMEHYDDVVVIEAPFDWNDVGSWGSLVRMHGTDDNGNTIEARHQGLKTRGCIIRGAPDHLIVTLGLDDCIVVQTPDATLVARKHDEESIRQVVELIEEQGWDEYL